MRLIIRFICISMLCSPILNYASVDIIKDKINSLLEVNPWCQDVSRRVVDNTLKPQKDSIRSKVLKNISSYPYSTTQTCLETLKSIYLHCGNNTSDSVVNAFFECAQLNDECQLTSTSTNDNIKNYAEYQKTTMQGGTEYIDSVHLVNNFELVGCD
ncbi:MAG: hypothetical protein ACON5A_01160 [Candidatus Comchoanobacterales bacterium]